MGKSTRMGVNVPSIDGAGLGNEYPKLYDMTPLNVQWIPKIERPSTS